jgi:sorbitol-specific phosphotransferase system component IIC
MTFTNFLQVLAFNLLSQIIPMCAFLGITMYFVIKYFEKRIARFISEEARNQHLK